MSWNRNLGPPRGRLNVLLVLVSATVSFGEAQPVRSARQRSLDFNRDIRPILSENCFACHGPDKNKRKAGLRLDRRAEATAKLESGERAVVPGDIAKSHLLKVVSAEDDDDRMPPKKTGKRLTKEQIAVLRDWIAAGAEFKEHWAYLPPERPPLPAVKNKHWPRNEIDHFIRARLEKEGLQPSPEAEKHTLIRRVTLDLTGLPPTVAEVDALLADKTPAAYEKVVDRLLASQAFGEKFAQQWLDLARYADSDGYHADVPRSMWQYRDYVIRAFNDNKPFDQFTVEQLAGDLLPSPTLDQRVATAFNRNGMSSTEGGADPDEYMNKYVTDRVNTFGTVYLGSSTACTECHDHKYDPFTQREYYQLYDFFNRIPEKGLDNDPAPPFVKVPVPEQTASLTKLTNEIASLETQRRSLLDKQDDALSREQAAWEEKQRQRVHAGWDVLKPRTVTASSGAELKTIEDLSLLASGTNAAKETYEVSLETDRRELTALRLEALTHDSLPLNGASRGTNGNFILTGFELEAESADPAKEPPVSEIEWGQWSALGSFKAASAKEVFEKAFINETELDFKKTYEDDRLRWNEKPDWKDGTAQALAGENQVTYFHRTITVQSARYINLTFGSDGGMQLWLNGAKVENGKIFRRVAPAPDAVMVLLKPGENSLLLKVHHGSGVYGFLFAPPKQPVTKYPVEFAKALADYSQNGFNVNVALDDKADTGWAVDGQDEKLRGNRQAIFLARRPITFAGGTRLKVKLRFESGTPQQVLGRFRLAASSSTNLDEFAGLPQNVQSALFAVSGQTSAAQQTELKEYYRENFYPELKTLNTKLADARKAAKELDAKIPTIRVMEDMAEPRGTQIRVRGDYRAKGDAVVAGVPRILPPLPPDEKTNRLTLAKWLVDPKHPLLSRVTVNRYWAFYFGTGLVKTGNEFGTQGELPSHPDLLDWLAREFIDSGWDIKAMQKRIVMSATYRQSSKPTPALLERDPNNRLLARGPRLRLSAEVIRDCALDYAGLLDRKRSPGGPSVKPYQPAGLWEEKMFGGNKYEESKGADLYRRSLYTLWKRTVLNPTLMTFDAPDRAICTEQRGLTCTPLQAFVTLNEKGFVEAARVLAERVLREGGADLNQRITFAYKTVLARPPSVKERKILAGVHADMVATYQNDLKAAVDLLSTGEARRAEKLNELDLVAWTTVANVLLNLDETITKE
ncbi:MAG: DUF1553 domain-containing protein [Verrucomicrobia bacterium]|nr:DUF1553 domain-containing protein [Verrucomicrobiota bacterium]